MKVKVFVLVYGLIHHLTFDMGRSSIVSYIPASSKSFAHL